MKSRCLFRTGVASLRARARLEAAAYRQNLKLLAGEFEEVKSCYDREKRQYYLMLPDGRLIVQNIKSGDFFNEGLGGCFLRQGARLLFGSRDGKLCL